MIRSLTAQVALAITAIIFLALALTGFLNYFKFERSFSIMLSSRFEAVLQDMKNTVETSLSLGLPLNALRNTQPLIEREKNQDEQILSIEVFEADGNVVFATDRSFIGDLISEQWLGQWRATPDNGHWTLREDDALVIGVPLVNNLDIEVGGIALRFSREFYDRTLRDMMFDLVKAALLVLAVTITASIIGASLVLRNTSRSFEAMSRTLRSVIAGRVSPLEVTLASSAAGISTLDNAMDDPGAHAEETDSFAEAIPTDPTAVEINAQRDADLIREASAEHIHLDDNDLIEKHFLVCLEKSQNALRDIDETAIAVRQLDEQE